MDFRSVRITPIDNSSLAAFNSFSGAGETSTDDNSIVRPAKRPRGRPKGSKNKPSLAAFDSFSGAGGLETRFLNSTVVGIPAGEPSPQPFENRFLNATAAAEIPTSEPSGNEHFIVRVKRPVGRPKDSKNKPKTVSPPLETRFLNSRAAVEVPAGKPTASNHVLGRVKRPAGRPKGSKNKPKTAQPPPPPPPLIEIKSEIDIEIPAGADVVQRLLEFCRYYQVSLKVLNASGKLSNIIPYHHPSSVILGSFMILSLSGTVMWTTNSEETIFPLDVSLASLNGTTFSGTVGRSATAASMVNVVAITMTAETVCHNPPNDSTVITARVSNASPQTPNHLFNEFYELLNPNEPIEVGIQLYDKLKEKYEEERDRMKQKSNNDELMMDEDIWRYEENLTPALRVAPYRF